MRPLFLGAWVGLGLLGLLLLGSQTPMCLGPVGISIVGCARGTGVLPSNATAQAFLGAWLFLGGLLALVARRPPRRALIAITALTLLAFPAGAALYALTRPLTLAGPSVRALDGRALDYVVLALPFEPQAALGFALGLAGLVLLGAAVWFSVRARRVS
jgi:hypothetical protein